MGAGKSTLGALLAQQLDATFLDSDVLMEETTGQRIATLFTTLGEPQFRELEHRVVATVAARECSVLALGGGAILHQATQELLKSTYVVYLKISPTTAKQRIEGGADRPLARSGHLEALLESRISTYQSMASLTLEEHDDETPAHTLARLVALLPEPYRHHLDSIKSPT
nr:shikimate kinase [Ferrimicrobium sp.]